MGGFIAGDMVGMYPDRMITCVMCSGGMRTSHPSVNDAVTAEEIAKADASIAAVKAQGVENWRREWINKLVVNGGSQAEKIRRRLTKIINSWDMWQLTNREPHLYYGHEAYDSLKARRPQVPTLYLSGETEHKGRMQMLNYLPISQQLVLKDCGHMSNMERPAEFNEMVLSFIHQYSRFPRRMSSHKNNRTK